MRLSTPRIHPVTDAEMDDEQREVIGSLTEGRRRLNVYRTLARAPKALKAYLAWGSYIVSKRNALSPREREIVILRVGVLCRSGYEVAQHTRIALETGMSAQEIAHIKEGAEAGWPPAEAALIRAADELVADHFVSEATWAALRSAYSEKQCVDVVLTAGQYVQTCMFLNTFGVQVEAG